MRQKRSIHSDNARRKLDGRGEARIIELACSPVPKGHARWTLRLLEEKGKVVLDTPVGKDAIRRALKKTSFSLTKTAIGASRQKKTQNLQRVWRMCWMYMSGLMMRNSRSYAWMKNRISCWGKPGNRWLCVPGTQKSRFRICPQRHMQYFCFDRAINRKTPCPCAGTPDGYRLGRRNPISFGCDVS